MQKKYPTVSISWPNIESLNRARLRAATLRLSLSNYIVRCVEKELESMDAARGQLTITARPIITVDHGVYMAEDSPTAPEADPPPSSLVAAWAHGVLHGDLREIQAHVTGKPSPDSTTPTTAGAPPRSPAPGTSSSSPTHKGISYGGNPSSKVADHSSKSKGQK